MPNRPFIAGLATCALGLLAARAASAGDSSLHRGTSAPSQAGACIDAGDRTTWAPQDDHTILVRSGRRSFRVTTNTCPALADPLARITRELQGGAPICRPRDMRLYVARSGDPISTPCVIQSITPLSDEEASALRTRRR